MLEAGKTLMGADANLQHAMAEISKTIGNKQRGFSVRENKFMGKGSPINKI